MGEYCLLRNNAYIGQDFSFILTPKRDNGALTEADEPYNAQISCRRVVVEQVFGCLEYRWRCLRDVQNTRTNVVVMIIVAACFLKNLCIGASQICKEHQHGCPRLEDEND